MENAAEDDNDACLEHSIVSHDCIEEERGRKKRSQTCMMKTIMGFLGSYLDGLALENASLTGCSDGHGGCRLRQ